MRPFGNATSLISILSLFVRSNGTMTYYELFTYKNLYSSYLKARKGKRHKTEVIQFEMNLSLHLNMILNEMITKTYKLERYNHFTIYEPKKRNIDSIPFKDRIVQHCLVDFYLMPLLDKRLIYDNCACRKGKGTDFARNRLKSFMIRYYRQHKTNEGYYFKIDIHHYFESIDHQILKDKLNTIVSDQDILKLCFMLIDSYNVGLNGRGMPLGSQISQCFALIYLDKIDRFIKEKYKIKFYVRYMDDLILIHHNKDYLKILKKDLQLILSELKLLYNPDKTFIKSLYCGMPFLGFNFSISRKGKLLIKVLNNKYRNFIRYKNSLQPTEQENICNIYKKYISDRQKF